MIRLIVKVLIIANALFFIRCSNKPVKNDTSVLKRIIDSVTIPFKVNNVDSTCLGYLPSEGNPGYGFTSILVVDSFMFISDNYHNNVKKYYIKGPECKFLNCSNKISNMLVGHMHFQNDTLFLLSRVRLKLNLLTKDLQPIKHIDLELNRSPEFTYYKEQVYISYSLVNSTVLCSVNNFHKKIELQDKEEGFIDDYWTFYRTWSYSYVDTSKIISNHYGRFQLNEEIPYLHYCEGENIAYSEKKLYVLMDDKVESHNEYILKIYTFN